MSPLIRNSGKPSGEVTTFYSYKGGTGRTFVLANVAFLLASQGKRVCVLDWDLEAPGLHRFFRPFLEDSELEITEGLIDWLWDKTAYQLSGTESSRDRALLEYYIVSLYSPQWELPNGGCLDFLPAGRQDSEYAKRVTSFDWNAFYDRLGGAGIIDEARNYLKANYDHVLIDSRTGLSDTSGICTIDLPDQLVACYTLNRQSIDGVRRILRTVQDRRGDRPLRIFPLATRLDTFEKNKLEAALRIARPLFREYTSEQAAPRGYWDDMEVSYWPFYAFEECVALFAEEPESQSKSSMLRSMCGITSRVFLNGSPVEPPHISLGARRRIMASYSLEPARSEFPAGEDAVLDGIFREVSVRYRNHAEGDGRLLDRDGLKQLDEAGALPALLANDEGFLHYLADSRIAARQPGHPFLWLGLSAGVVAFITFGTFTILLSSKVVNGTDTGSDWLISVSFITGVVTLILILIDIAPRTVRTLRGLFRGSGRRQ
jgi:MinD-like ATPase involved in chromosome partitioning or flagellar assembly